MADSTNVGGTTGGKPASASQISFESFTKLLETIVRTPQKNGRKVKVLRRFCQQQLPRRDGNDLFHFYRLLLPSPQVERERGSYQLKEAKLAAVLAGAVGASSADVERAKQWRSLNSTRSGVFHEVMYEVLFRKYLLDPQLADPQGPPLTLEEVNSMLDELVRRAGDSVGQQGLLGALLRRCSPGAARVLVTLIMKDIKIGMSPDTVLAAYHPDAPDVLNGCMDLRRVLVELIDPTARVKKKDVVPGQPAKPQLADRCDGGVAVAARRMSGRRFVVEVKFDGERMQVHRTGPDSFNFFSRRGLDHGSRRDFTVLGPALCTLMSQERMILDGEMVVWNKSRQVFEPFGGLTSAIDAVNRGAGPGERLRMKMGTAINTSDPDYVFPSAADVEVVFVAFDVLFFDGGSVLHKPLGERHQLLQRALRSCPPEGLPVGPPGGVIRFRALPLLPGVPMLGGEVYSKEGTGEDDIKDVYERALAKQEEGIVVKALDSPYKLNDRSGSWLKVKPDYVDSSEFDTVVIGAMWGTGGRRGGRLSEFLLALADTPHVPGASPHSFVSFCRVGTGLSGPQVEWVREQLRPLLVELGPGQRPPRCYRVTGQLRERPDVWVREPLRSVVLTVKADVRTIVSDTFASRYSLRFPRIVAIREDKGPREATSLGELERMVLERAKAAREARAGALGAGGHDKGGGGKDGGGRRRPAGTAGRGGLPGRIAVARVPLALRPVDVSHVEVEVELLGGRYVLLREMEPEQRRRMAALVKRMGGVETQNYVPSGPQATSFVVVGRCDPPRLPSDPLLGPIAARADLLRPEWLTEVSELRELREPPRPSLAWSISGATREQYSAVIDPYGDPYFDLLGEEDLAAVLSRHVTPHQLAEARRALEGAAAMPARARRRARQLDARRQPEGRTTLYETVDDVVRRIRDEIHDVGEKPPPGSMFLGLTLLFLEMHDMKPPPAPPPRAAAPLGLLAGVADCEARAHAWAVSDPRDRVEALKAAVVRHGGVVVEAWDERVTHLVLYDGVDEVDQQLRPVLNAERQCRGLAPLPALSAAAAAAAATTSAAAAAAAAAAAREFSPEEVIEALIEMAECAADEDAAAEAEEDVAAEAAAGDGGSADGEAAEAAAARRLSREQARCLSLIRAALERPQGAVEAVGAVQLVDWRWVRDSLQRAADAAATAEAAKAAAAVRRAAAGEGEEGEEGEEEGEEENAAAASAVGTLSELDYPPHIRPPEEWLLTQQRQQHQGHEQEQAPPSQSRDREEGGGEAGGGGCPGPGAEAVAPRRSAFHGGGGGDDGCSMAGAAAPGTQPQPCTAAGGGGGGVSGTLGSIWRSILDVDSDEEDDRAGYRTTTAAAPPPSPALLLRQARLDAAADGGGTAAEPAASIVASPPLAAEAAAWSHALLPPPDEFIKLWPWQRFRIALPAPEDLAKLGTHRRRRNAGGGSVGSSTVGTTSTSGGGATAATTTTGGGGGGHGSDGGSAEAAGGGCGGGGASRGRSQGRAADSARLASSPVAMARGAGGRARGGGRRGAEPPAPAPSRTATQTAASGRRRRGAGGESGPDAAAGRVHCSGSGAEEGSGGGGGGGGGGAGGYHIEDACSPVAAASKAPRQRTGRVRGGEAAAPRANRKRMAAAAAAVAAGADNDGADGGGEEEAAAATMGPEGRKKRPRRTAAVAAAAAAAAALAREEEEEEEEYYGDTWSPPPATAAARSGLGRRRLVQLGESGDEGRDDGAGEAPAVEPRPVAAAAGEPRRAVDGGGAADGGGGGSAAMATTAGATPATPLRSEAGPQPQALSAAFAAAGETAVAAGAAAAAEPPPTALRKRRLKDLVAAPYGSPVRVAGAASGGGGGTGTPGASGPAGPRPAPAPGLPQRPVGRSFGLSQLLACNIDEDSDGDGGGGSDWHVDKGKQLVLVPGIGAEKGGDGVRVSEPTAPFGASQPVPQPRVAAGMGQGVGLEPSSATGSPPPPFVATAAAATAVPWERSEAPMLLAARRLVAATAPFGPPAGEAPLAVEAVGEGPSARQGAGVVVGANGAGAGAEVAADGSRQACGSGLVSAPTTKEAVGGGGSVGGGGGGRSVVSGLLNRILADSDDDDA